jgi:hypothetical protein
MSAEQGIDLCAKGWIAAACVGKIGIALRFLEADHLFEDVLQLPGHD